MGFELGLVDCGLRLMIFQDMSPTITEMRPFKNVDRENANKWKMINLVSIKKSPGYIPFLVIVPAQTAATIAYSSMKNRTSRD